MQVFIPLLMPSKTFALISIACTLNMIVVDIVSPLLLTNIWAAAFIWILLDSMIILQDLKMEEQSNANLRALHHRDTLQLETKMTQILNIVNELKSFMTSMQAEKASLKPQGSNSSYDSYTSEVSDASSMVYQNSFNLNSLRSNGNMHNANAEPITVVYSEKGKNFSIGINNLARQVLRQSTDTTSK